jgi:hypothetical protein
MIYSAGKQYGPQQSPSPRAYRQKKCLLIARAHWIPSNLVVSITNTKNKERDIINFMRLAEFIIHSLPLFPRDLDIIILLLTIQRLLH